MELTSHIFSFRALVNGWPVTSSSSLPRPLSQETPGRGVAGLDDTPSENEPGTQESQLRKFLVHISYI